MAPLHHTQGLACGPLRRIEAGQAGVMVIRSSGRSGWSIRSGAPLAPSPHANRHTGVAFAQYVFSARPAGTWFVVLAPILAALPHPPAPPEPPEAPCLDRAEQQEAEPDRGQARLYQ